jgi:hypothetical protein
VRKCEDARAQAQLIFRGKDRMLVAMHGLHQQCHAPQPAVPTTSCLLTTPLLTTTPAGHAVPRRHRVLPSPGQRPEAQPHHQVPPQCGRPAQGPAVPAGGALQGAVQGRGAPDRKAAGGAGAVHQATPIPRWAAGMHAGSGSQHAASTGVQACTAAGTSCWCWMQMYTCRPAPDASCCLMPPPPSPPTSHPRCHT